LPIKVYENKRRRMKKFVGYFREQPLSILLFVAPFAVLAHYLNWGETWVFVLSALALVPLAGLIGEATEVLAEFTGPRLGGLVNATLGNAAELIITIVALKAGLTELVKASITGSILGNILLVFGMAILFGGFKNGLLVFNRRHVANNAILLVLAVVALVIPSLLSVSIGDEHSLKVEALSLGVAGVMVLLYVLGIIFSLKMKPGQMVNGVVHTGPLAGVMPVESNAPEMPAEGQTSTRVTITKPIPGQGRWSLRVALGVLAIATVGVAYLSELLVGSVEPVVKSLGVSEFFLGIILIPLIGNIAEHLVAVKVAMKNQTDLSIEIVMASSLQIALFVAPVLVFISLFFRTPLLLIFNGFELLALVIGALIAALVTADGEANWLEGAALLAVYVILALAFFLIPAA
jgi:Ca2+:H+ antiporter